MADNQDEEEGEGYTHDQIFKPKSTSLTDKRKYVIIISMEIKELFNDYLVVKSITEKETDSGIIINTEDSSDKYIVGEVLNGSSELAGRRVLFNQYSFDKVECLGKDVFIGKREGLVGIV